MPGRLAGKAIAITGAESGLGRAMALRAASEGASVAAAGLDAQGLQMVSMNAVVEPEEIAALVAFALSDEAPHMTGTLLKVDGGRTSA